jgi:hypothetical protein
VPEVSPNNYSTVSQQAQDARRDVLNKIVAEMTRPLSMYVETQPCDTFDEKRSLASWVNAETQRLGLRLQCPNTGLPATLSAELSPTGSRFSLHIRTDDQRNVKSFSSKRLPRITLMIDPAEFSPRARVKTHERTRGQER